MLSRRRVTMAALLAMSMAAAVRLPDLRAQARAVNPALYSGLRWRMLGPFRGGRVNAVSGVPGRPNVFYFGSVGGGVWKTLDTGRTWMPVFDSQPVASIGAIAVAPSRPEVVYVGTGEADMRDSIAFGDGMYKSMDGGQTWSHIGLETTRQIGKVAVDPRNPDVVFVAALGHVYGPHPDRGVYRSRDGGRSWQKVLYKNDSVGAIDVAIDPSNPQIVYASLWNTRRPPWYIYAPSNGLGGGIYKSTDGGTTWNQLTNGLPTDGFGRSGLAIAPSMPTRIYAVVDAKEGGLFRTDDGGAMWTRVSSDQRLWGRGWYFSKAVVDPKNPDRVYVANTAIYHSSDGGVTWGNPKGSPGGDDYHQLWIYPDNPELMIAASDQGAIITENASSEQPTWSSWLNQPTAQIYHLAPDLRFPYWITGAQQDSGAVGVATRGKFGQISMRDWEPLCAGGESGYTAPDPLHPGILYGGTVSRCNVTTNSDSANVSPERSMTEPARHAWTQPLVFSRADPHALYFANQFLYKTTDGGEHWTQISQDLTRENPDVPSNLDEAAAADVAPNSTARRGVIYTIAPSPLQAPLLWTGTDDGYIWRTTDDGKTWANVTPAALTPWSKVTVIEASHFDAYTAYAAVERHQLEDYEPYIYRTRDAGRTWQRIVKGLPAGIYVQTVKEDPRREGLLFAGTERAVYVSFDSGDAWLSLQLNLPATSMRDLAVSDTDLTVATHGRGFWTIDDISALRQADSIPANASAFLFKPSDAIGAAPGSDNGTPLQKDEPQAPNPPAGAIVDYYLSSAAPSVTLEILDSTGNMIRRYSSDDRPPASAAPPNVSVMWRPAFETLSAAAGMHRWIWDLRPTPPAGGRGGRGAGGGGGGGGFGRGGAPMVQPGAYTVKLTVNGQSLTQPLAVKPDPRAAR